MSCALRPRGRVTSLVPGSADAARVGEVLVGLGLGGAAGFERCCPVPSTQRPSHRKGICSECPPGVLPHPLLGEHPSPSRSLPEPPSASAPSSWHPAHVHPGGSTPGTGARGGGRVGDVQPEAPAVLVSLSPAQPLPHIPLAPTPEPHMVVGHQDQQPPGWDRPPRNGHRRSR